MHTHVHTPVVASKARRRFTSPLLPSCSATTARALGEAAVATAPTGGAWARGCGCSPMTLPAFSYEELVTTHHFIGVAPMRLVEQIRALYDYQGAWVYARSHADAHSASCAFGYE